MPSMLLPAVHSLLKMLLVLLGFWLFLFLCTLPVVKILSAAVMYRLAAALLQPLGAQELSESLHLLGNYLLLVFGCCGGGWVDVLHQLLQLLWG
jgi:hypothetical protein